MANTAFVGFVDESTANAKAVPYCRLALLCDESAVGILRSQVEALGAPLRLLSKKDELSGSTVFNALRVANATANSTTSPAGVAQARQSINTIEAAVDGLFALLKPKGAVWIVAAGALRDDGTAVQRGAASILGADALHTLAIVRRNGAPNGEKLAKVLSAQLLYERLYEATRVLDAKSVRVIHDDFPLVSDDRLLLRLVEDAMVDGWRSKHAPPYIQRVAFVPSVYEPLVQLADFLCYFWVSGRFKQITTENYARWPVAFDGAVEALRQRGVTEPAHWP